MLTKSRAPYDEDSSANSAISFYMLYHSLEIIPWFGIYSIPWSGKQTVVLAK